MRLKNKRTGEIGVLSVWRRADNDELTGFAVLKENEKFPTDYNSLAELSKEWEDAPEEPKTHWMIDTSVLEPVREIAGEPYEIDKEIGNWFSTKEEAELAVRKLEAFKRLEDKGFRFIGKTYETDKRFGSVFYKVDEDTYSEDIVDDLDLLFCPEENS